MKTNIAFFGSDVLLRVYTPEIREKIGSRADVCFITPERLRAEKDICKNTEYIFTSWGMPHYTTEQIRECFPSLKAVFYGAGSVQGFAREFLECEVRVFSAWAANAVPVAEFTTAQIILAGKRYFDIFTGVKLKPKGNYRNSIGLLGLGMIGTMVAARLREYDCSVYAFDAFKTEDECAALGVKKTGLSELFESCDIISNHLANNVQTKGMITRELLLSMKEDACFINTGRGAQVSSDGLYEAMAQKPGRVCLLDVTEPEPLPENSPLLTLKNVLISPHIAGSVGCEVGRMGEYMYNEFMSVLNGNDVKYEVTIDMLRYMA